MAIVCYALICSPTGKAYVGVTAGNLNKRMREHRCLLRGGKHTSKALQADWGQYGEASFACVSLETSDGSTIEAKREVKQRWLDHYRSRGLLYNAYVTSYRMPDHIQRMGVDLAHRYPGKRWTPEANLKRSLAQKGKPKGHGAKISATKQARKAMR